jgi:hypothetical protein
LLLWGTIVAMEDAHESANAKRNVFVRLGSKLVAAAEYLFDQCIHVGDEYGRIIAREKELFFGVALFCIGLLSFDHGKYCDGNTADYLSCTRPETYYYFGYLDIALVVVGISLVLIWALKPAKVSKKPVH